MKSIIGIILIVLAVAFGWDGIQKFRSSDANVNILGIKISAKDSGTQQGAVLEVGLAVLFLAGGIYLVRSSSR